MSLQGDSPKYRDKAEYKMPSLMLVDPTEESHVLESELKSMGYSVTIARERKTAISILHRSPIDIIISPAEGGGRLAVNFFGEARSIAPAIQCIALIKAPSPDLIFALINEGGVDQLLMHPIDVQSLKQAIEKLWESARMRAAWVAHAEGAAMPLEAVPTFNKVLELRTQEQTESLVKTNEELRLANVELEHKLIHLSQVNNTLKVQSTTDPLTGLYNRREFLTRLRLEWGRLRRYQRPISLIMLDIDHFKEVNDNFGHECGDTVLSTLSSVIRRYQRSQDITCRYGGEEFIVLMPETSLDAAFGVAENLREIVGNHGFRCKRHPISVHISLGVAGALEHHPDDSEAFIKMADQAMYRAKSLGRNCTVAIDPDDPDKELHISPGGIA